MAETWRTGPRKHTLRVRDSEKRISNLTSRSSIPAPGPLSTNWTQLADSGSLSPTVLGNRSGTEHRQLFREYGEQDHVRRTSAKTKRHERVARRRATVRHMQLQLSDLGQPAF